MNPYILPLVVTQSDYRPENSLDLDLDLKSRI